MIKWFLLDGKATLVARYPGLATVDAPALFREAAAAAWSKARRTPLAVRLALGGAMAAALGGALYLMMPGPPPALRLAEALAYNLVAVRAGRPVNAVFVDAAGSSFRDIADAARRKDLFLRLMLPLVLRENARIMEDRKRVLRSPSLGKKDLYDRYGVAEGDTATLSRRADIVPPSLVLAQAAIESGWGTSRFADIANNFFGQRTYDAAVDGVAPDDADGSFRVRRFPTVAASVRSYLYNLNTHRAYAGFRRAREAMRRDGKVPSGLDLARHLTAYSERRGEYTRSVERVIRRNHLQDFDTARLASR
jgi:Bax protein